MSKTFDTSSFVKILNPALPNVIREEGTPIFQVQRRDSFYTALFKRFDNAGGIEIEPKSEKLTGIVNLRKVT